MMKINLGNIKIVQKGDYSAATEYVIDDYVFYEGDTFISKTGTVDKPNKDNQPKTDGVIDGDNWTYMAKGAQSVNTSDWSPGDTVGTWLVNSKLKDRGIYRNDLVETGTVDSAPIADGSALQAYSGFTTDNYLELETTNGRQFSNRNWSLLGWVKIGDYDYDQTMFEWAKVNEDDSSKRDGDWIKASLDADNVFHFKVYSHRTDETYDLTTDVEKADMLDKWMMIAVIRDGASLAMVDASSGTKIVEVEVSESFKLENPDATMSIGVDAEKHLPFKTGGMSLIRITDFALLGTQLTHIFDEEMGYVYKGAQFSIAQNTGQLYINKDLINKIDADNKIKLIQHSRPMTITYNDDSTIKEYTEGSLYVHDIVRNDDGDITELIEETDISKQKVTTSYDDDGKVTEVAIKNLLA